MDELTRERFGDLLPEVELYRRPGPRKTWLTKRAVWPTVEQLRRQRELIEATTKEVAE